MRARGPTGHDSELFPWCIGPSRARPLFRSKPPSSGQVTSISGKRTISTLAGAAYCASKFAQQSLGNAINLEEYGNGIRCTNIAPGEVATPILDARPQPPSAERRAQMLNPEDIAAAVVMVAKLPKVAHVTEIIMTGKTTVPEAVL
jgi:NADP-dependent 3-hydroxy acid dehydrogenase YdfG